MRLLLVGATGLVGRAALALALGDPRVDAVTAPVRRPIAAHPKLLAPVVDFERFSDGAAWLSADAVVCALGTTMRKAGSKDAFRRVDHEIPLAVSGLAHGRGAQAFALTSAIGADASSSFFYNRVKGELERDLALVGFRSLTFVRPGLIGGTREEPRPAERAAAFVLGVLGPALPRRWRICPPERIAAALVEAAIAAKPGVKIVPADELA